MPLLNLSESDLDQRIYRITKPDYVYSLFHRRENVLVSPRKWDDPFENFVLNSPAMMPNGETIEWGFRNDFYGQCWTFHKASDAMWRIYSTEKTGIRLRTTIRKALTGLAARARADHQAFIGRVSYLSARKLKQFGNSAIGIPLNASDFASTLLVKRLAFEHEKEVRLLFLAEPGDSVEDGTFRYAVDPHTMIDQMMVDPRLGPRAADDLISKIRARTRFKGRILRSLLYATPIGFRFRINPV
jgi:hypothetical protein